MGAILYQTFQLTEIPLKCVGILSDFGVNPKAFFPDERYGSSGIQQDSIEEKVAVWFRESLDSTRGRCCSVSSSVQFLRPCFSWLALSLSTRDSCFSAAIAVGFLPPVPRFPLALSGGRMLGISGQEKGTDGCGWPSARGQITWSERGAKHTHTYTHQVKNGVCPDYSLHAVVQSFTH